MEKNWVAVISIAKKVRGITECILKYIRIANCTVIVKCSKVHGFVEFLICHSVNET